MNELWNWEQVTRGLFRYVVAASVCYEIHILKQDMNRTNWDDGFLTDAEASLYLVGEWALKNGESLFTRDAILERATVKACLERAVEDAAENNS